jgi:hypothetical protein
MISRLCIYPFKTLFYTVEYNIVDIEMRDVMSQLLEIALKK